MLHIFYGDEPTILQYEKHLLKNKLHNEVKEILFDENHQIILDEVMQGNLFSENKYFIIEDAKFIISTKDHDLWLTKQLNNVSVDIYIFLETKKLTNFNDEVTKTSLHKLEKLNEKRKNELIDKTLVSLKSKFDSIESKNLFNELTNNNPFLIENELRKLSIVNTNNIITKLDVQNMVQESLSMDVFKLVNHWLTNDKKSLLTLFDELILHKYQPMELLMIMSSQMFNLKILKLAHNQRLSPFEIEQKLKIKRFVQNVNNLLINKVSIEQINQYLSHMYTLDYNIKHSIVDPYLGLKLMLIE